MAATTLLAIALLHTASASLSIRARYRGADFLEHFAFFSADDPTHGWVDYLDRADAMAAGLVDVADDGTFFMGAGRPKTAAARLPSVRIEGRHSIAGGLAVLDVEAVPVGCGAWPAFWMCNQTDPATAGTPAAWPAGGEIDVLEGVHLSRVSATTLHAGPGCTRKFKSAYAAPPYAGNETWNGDCNAGTGCGIVGADGGMGAGFNDLGGGVYATEFSPQGAAQAIKVWFRSCPTSRATKSTRRTGACPWPTSPWPTTRAAATPSKTRRSSSTWRSAATGRATSGPRRPARTARRRVRRSSNPSSTTTTTSRTSTSP